MLSTLYTLPTYDFDLRATHARTHPPAALASVSFGFVLVRVRVRVQGAVGDANSEVIVGRHWERCAEESQES